MEETSPGREQEKLEPQAERDMARAGRDQSYVLQEGRGQCGENSGKELDLWKGTKGLAWLTHKQ